jgi:hypothetical protein
VSLWNFARACARQAFLGNLARPALSLEGKSNSIRPFSDSAVMVRGNARFYSSCFVEVGRPKRFTTKRTKNTKIFRAMGRLASFDRREI